MFRNGGPGFFVFRLHGHGIFLHFGPVLTTLIVRYIGKLQMILVCAFGVLSECLRYDLMRLLWRIFVASLSAILPSFI